MNKNVSDIVTVVVDYPSQQNGINVKVGKKNLSSFKNESKQC